MAKHLNQILISMFFFVSHSHLAFKLFRTRFYPLWWDMHVAFSIYVRVCVCVFTLSCGPKASWCRVLSFFSHFSIQFIVEAHYVFWLFVYTKIFHSLVHLFFKYLYTQTRIRMRACDTNNDNIWRRDARIFKLESFCRAFFVNF